ncbi:MAG: PPC domain-containing protein [Spirulina sp.]
MKHRFARYCYSTLLASTTLVTVGLGTLSAKAQEMYNPFPLVSGEEIEDVLSQKDIPTGEGGFSRDYKVKLEQGDNVAIDLLSDEFDPIVILIATDGSTVAENDDGPDGTTNSLLFARIKDEGEYIVRVRAFGETGGGKFRLKVTRLKPI